jgi:predicted enzyme related to lactoylglutathione lyase
MEIHRGRLIDHIHLRAHDLAASKRFYRAVLQVTGQGRGHPGGRHHFSADELWIDKADGATPHVHLAFRAKDHAEVKAFYEAALPPAAPTTARPANANTIRAITRPLCWTRTATTSKRFTMGPSLLRPSRW